MEHHWVAFALALGLTACSAGPVGSAAADDDSAPDWFPVSYELVWTGDTLLADLYPVHAGFERIAVAAGVMVSR